MNQADLERFFLLGEAKEAAIRHIPENDSYQIQTTHGVFPIQGKVASIVALAQCFHIKAAFAEELIRQAADAPHQPCKFWLEEKHASAIKVVQDPEFHQNYDADFGVPVEGPQRFLLATDATYLRPPTNRIGDHYDNTLRKGTENQDSNEGATGIPKEVLMTASPEQLAGIAQQGNFPNVLEHGIVGSLVDTFDSSAMIDKYLPDMEKGLDRLGRSLFLFYWKPQDFEKDFGVDDMTNIENELLSNFKSNGDLVLRFLKKNKDNQGSVSL